MNEYVLIMLIAIINININKIECVDLKLEIRKISEHRSILTTLIGIGTPIQKINVLIDINSSYSWVQDGFKPSLSKTDNVLSYLTYNVNQQIDNYFIQGYHLKDKAEIAEIILPNFTFLFIFKSSHFNLDITNLKGVLGLHSGDDIEKRSNSNISFINRAKEQFFKKRIIKLYLNCSLDESYKHHKEILTIGQTKDDIEHQFELCDYINNTLSQEDYFKCYLNHIYIGKVPQKNSDVPFAIKKDGSIKIDSFVYFSTIDQFSFCNYEQFLFIIKNYFENMINKQECFLKYINNTYNNDTTTIIMCDYIAITQMDKINFVLNNNSNIILSILANDFFIKEPNGFRAFAIAHKESNHKWIFGYELMKLLPIGFNHEDYTVRLYYHPNSNHVLYKIDDNSIDFTLSDIDINKLTNKYSIICKRIIMICNVIVLVNFLLLIKLKKNISYV